MRRIEDIFKDKQENLKNEMFDYVKDQKNPLISRFKVLELCGEVKGDVYELETQINTLFHKWITTTDFLTRYKCYTYSDMLEHMGYDIDSYNNPKTKESNPTIEEILDEAVNGKIFGCFYDW